MRSLFLSLAAVLVFGVNANAQSLEPSDVPASVLVNVSASTFNAAPLTTLVCDATSNAVLVTLPDATKVSAGKGLKVMMVKTGSSHHVTFATLGSQTINTLSASSFNSDHALTAEGTGVTFVSNGSNWVASTGSL